MITLTPAMKVALGAAGAGLVGGVVAERLMSPGPIDHAKQGNRWDALHDDFLKEHPAPAGTHVYVNQEPAWKGAALAGGAAAGVTALGGAALYGAKHFHSGPLAIAGAGLLALGIGAGIGVGSSWAVR